MICLRTALFSALFALSCSATYADSNLIRNPSFEESGAQFSHAAFWKMGEPDTHGDAWGSASREDWRSRDGMYILVVRGQWAGTDDHGGCWQEVGAIPGVTYYAAAWFWADESWSPKKQEIKIEFWNTDYSQKLAEKSHALEDIGPEWTHRHLSATAPNDAAWARLVINVDGVGEAGALQIDSVYMSTAENVDEPEPQPVRALIEVLDGGDE